MDRMRLEGVPPAVIEDAERVVAEWNAASGADLDTECAAALASHVAFAIGAAIEAAARNPEAFAKNLTGPDDEA